MLLLLIVYDNLTLIFANGELVNFVTLEFGVFGVLTSIEEGTLGLKLNYHFSRELQCMLLHSFLSHGGLT
jgi:hypothetical protein